MVDAIINQIIFYVNVMVRMVCVYFFENNHQAYKSREFSVEFFQKKYRNKVFLASVLTLLAFSCYNNFRLIKQSVDLS